jgi:chromosome segregation ATPase
MADVAERFATLEREIQRAVELIGSLREENRRLRDEHRELSRRVEGLTAELGTLRHREQVLGRVEGQRRQLLDERRQLLAQVEGMLKELSRIEGV